MEEQALAGVKVVDLSHYLAGPYCTKLLADYGAEVTKIERPDGGDGARRLGPFPNDEPDPEKSGMFLYLNTNKQGITLNLKSETGRMILTELAKDADILVESFRPGVMESLGLGCEALEEVNPRLIVISISNFGQTGPYRDFKLTDLIAYAVSGILYVSGSYDREPIKHGIRQAGYWGGGMAAVAAMVALWGQRMTGEGQHVDVSIMEAMVSGFNRVGEYPYNGAIARRDPKDGGGIVGSRIMPCKDGYIAPVLGGGMDWETFAAFVDIPELIDPRFVTADDRSLHAAEINALVLPKFMEQGKQELFHSAQEWRFPFSMVQTPEDLVNCPQLESRDFWVETEHPAAGRVMLPGLPFNMSESPGNIHSPAPTLGQHNQEVYCGRLGYRVEDLVRLRETGVI